MKLFYFFLIFFINANAINKFPIYANEDGNIHIDVEWTNANDENTEVMDFQTSYKNCMQNEASAIKNERFCIDSIDVELEPFSTKCITYYYGAIEVRDKNGKFFSGNEFQKVRYNGKFRYKVKKGDLIGYTYNEEKSKVTIIDSNRLDCKK